MDETQTMGTLAEATHHHDRIASVVVLSAPGEAGRGTVWQLRGPLVFGRTAPDTEALGDGRMSRRHAEITPNGDAWHLTDLKSRNGTSVGGRPLDGPHVLQHGDVFRVGASVLLFAWLSADTAGDDLGLAGIGGAVQQVREQLRAVAPHPHTVLLLGETGTGKEVAAQALHRASRRRGAFVALNCGALAPSMLESELFGHKKGAFTGAVADSPGVFRAADGGTLFLDEIGEMPMELQTRLLRVLETRSVRPVGGTRELPVDVRVVAATHRDPVERVRAGDMRTDLYARLAQWIVRLPPLRERREDLPALVTALLARMNAQEAGLTPELAIALALHPWPLNVRGLNNVLSTARIASTGPLLELSEPVRMALASAASLVGAAPPVSMKATVAEPKKAPDEAAVRQAMEAHGGGVASAARALGLSRQQLYRLAKKLDVDLSAYRT